MMKSRILLIVISVFLLLPISASAEDNTVQYDEETQHISKKKLIKKFLIAMFGVAMSSLILYLGLTIYNKARDNFNGPVKTPEGETPLETPYDLQGAVRSFLDKTEWR